MTSSMPSLGPIRRAQLAHTPALLLAAWVLGMGMSAPASASITGVCPDGSMFIVHRAADIPCPDAKQVEPHDLPPIRPEYLPRPYGWQVFQNKQDPNNPYNMVDSAREIREAGQPIDEPGTSVTAPTTRPAPPPVAAAPPRALTLTPDETRDLVRIVELSQRRAAARFGDGADPLVVELAHSRAFEARLREHYSGETLGPVVLFRVAAAAPAAFHGNFTFVQGSHAFHPQSANPKQFGVLAGALGAQSPGDRLLGYAVLPPQTDLAAPVDIYWNDRLISTSLDR